MGGCISGRTEEFSKLVTDFEATSLPWSKLTLQEYEDRVKRLIFEDDKDQITFS